MNGDYQVEIQVSFYTWMVLYRNVTWEQALREVEIILEDVREWDRFEELIPYIGGRISLPDGEVIPLP